MTTRKASFVEGSRSLPPVLRANHLATVNKSQRTRVR